MTKTIYINAKHKKDLLMRLDAGVPVFGSVFDGLNEDIERLQSMPHGTRVALRRSRVRPTFAVMTWDAINGTCK